MKAAKVFRKVGHALTRIGKSRADNADDEGSSWSDSEFSDEDESMLTDDFTDDQTDDYDDEEDGSDVFSGTNLSDDSDDYFDDEDDIIMSSSMASDSFMTPVSQSTSEVQTKEDTTTTVSNEDTVMSSPTLTTAIGPISPRRWLKSPLHLMGRHRMFRRHNTSPKDNATPDSAAIRAAEALGKDLETMGYNLDCQSFITKDGSSRAASEPKEIDRYKRPPLPNQRMLSLDSSAGFDPVMQDRSTSLTFDKSEASSLPPSQVSMTRSIDNSLHGASTEQDIILHHKLVEENIRRINSVASGKSRTSVKSEKSLKSNPSKGHASVEASLSHNYHDDEGKGGKKGSNIHERTVIEVSLALSPDNSFEHNADAGLSAVSSAEEEPVKELRVSTDYASSLPMKKSPKSPKSPRRETKVESPSAEEEPVKELRVSTDYASSLPMKKSQKSPKSPKSPRRETEVESPEMKSPRSSPRRQEKKESPTSPRQETKTTSPTQSQQETTKPKSPQHQSPRFDNASEHAQHQEKRSKSQRSSPPTRQMSPKSPKVASPVQAKNNVFVERKRTNESEVSESTSVTVIQTDKQANSACKQEEMEREQSNNTDSTNSAVFPRVPSAFTSTVNTTDEQIATLGTTIETSKEDSTNKNTEEGARVRSGNSASTNSFFMRIPSVFMSDMNNNTTSTAQPIVETVEEGDESVDDGKQQEHTNQEMERERSGNTESTSTLSVLAGIGMASVFPNNANKKPVKTLEEIDENEAVGSGRQQKKQPNAATEPKQPSQRMGDKDKKSDILIDGISLVEEDGGISVCSKAIEDTEGTAMSEEQEDASSNKSTISSKSSSKSSRAILLKKAVEQKRMRRHGDASTVPAKPPMAPKSSSARRTTGCMSPKSLPAKPRSPLEETNMALQALRDSITLKKSLSKLEANKSMKETDKNIEDVATPAASHDGATTLATMHFGEKEHASVKEEVGIQTVLSPRKEAIAHANKKEKTTAQSVTATGATMQVIGNKEETSRPPDESKLPLSIAHDQQSNDKDDHRNTESETKSTENAEALKEKVSMGGTLKDNEPTQKGAVKDARVSGPRLFGWRSRSLSPEKRSRTKQPKVAGWRKARAAKETTEADTDVSSDCKPTLPDLTDHSRQPESTRVTNKALADTISPTAVKDSEILCDTAILQQPEPSNTAEQENTPKHQHNELATETDSKAPVVTECTTLSKPAESPAVSEGSTPGSTATAMTKRSKSNRVVRFSFFKKKDEMSEGVAKPKGGTTRGILKKKKKKEPNHVEMNGPTSSLVAVEDGTTSEVLSSRDGKPLSPEIPFQNPLDLQVECSGEMSEDIEVKIQSPATSLASPKMLMQAHSSKLEAIEEVDSNFEEDTVKSLDGKGIEMNLKGVLVAAEESLRKDGIIAEGSPKEETVPRSSPRGNHGSVFFAKSPKAQKSPDTAARSPTIADKSTLRENYQFERSRPLVGETTQEAGPIQQWGLLDNLLSCGGVEGTGIETYGKTSNGKADDNTSSQERSEESSSAPFPLKNRDKKPKSVLSWWGLKNFVRGRHAKDPPPDFKASGSDSSQEIYGEGIEVENSVKDVEDEPLAIALVSPTVAAAAKSALDAVEATTNCASPKSAKEILRNLQTSLAGKPPLLPKKNGTGGKSLSSPSVSSVLDPKKNPDAEKLLEFLSTRDPSFTHRNKVPSRLVIDLDYDEGSCLTSLPSVTTDMNKKKQQRPKEKPDGENMKSKSIDSTDADAWEQIAKASLIVENAIKTFMPGVDGGKTVISSVGEEVEMALETLKLHSERLGVKESDLLLAVQSNEGSSEDQSAANDQQPKATGLIKDDAGSSVEASVPSLTFGEEILEAFKMYVKDMKVA